LTLAKQPETYFHVVQDTSLANVDGNARDWC
jgi:hypothetical protein